MEKLSGPYAFGRVQISNFQLFYSFLFSLSVCGKIATPFVISEKVENVSVHVFIKSLMSFIIHICTKEVDWQ